MASSSHQAKKLESPRKRAPWVAVSGGKGGVGKTVIATNLALMATEAGYRTLIVDMDPGLANVDVHLRVHVRHSIEDLARGDCTLDQALVAGPSGLALLAGRSGSVELASGDGDLLAAIFTAIEDATPLFDLVVLDTGAGLGPAVLQTVSRADLVLGVTTPDPASLTDAYALCKVLIARGCAAPRIVINQALNREQAFATVAKLAKVSRRFLDIDISLIGWVSSDPGIHSAVRGQRPFVLSGSGPAMEDLRSLTTAVLSAAPPVNRPRRSTRKVQSRLLVRPGRD